MNLIAGAANQVISSRQSSYLLGALWLFNIWGSIWYLAPGTDDGAFISLAFGFQSQGDLVLNYFFHFQEFFINLPGYHFSQALFFWIWDQAGLPINLYTFKTFQLLTVTLLLILSCRLLAVAADSADGGQSYRFNVFLVLLAASPFIIDSLYMRAEPFGLMLTVSAILLFGGNSKDSFGNLIRYAAAAFLLGVAATAHPTFVMTSCGLSAIAVFILWRRRVFGGLIISFLAFSLPIAAAASWFLWHQPESLEILSRHVATRSHTLGGMGKGLTQILEYMVPIQASGKSVAVRLYYAVCFWTLFGSSVGLILGVLRTAFRRGIVIPNVYSLMVHAFFVLTLLNVALDKSARIQIYTVLGFTTVLALATRLRARRTS